MMVYYERDTRDMSVNTKERKKENIKYSDQAGSVVFTAESLIGSSRFSDWVRRDVVGVASGFPLTIPLTLCQRQKFSFVANACSEKKKKVYMIVFITYCSIIVWHHNLAVGIIL